jgi:hypothetical protein
VKNPRGAPQPDLFGGESATFVPLEKLSDAEVKQLSFESFTPDEITELWVTEKGEKIVRAIIERDKPSYWRLELAADKERWMDLPLGVQQLIATHTTPPIPLKTLMEEDLWDTMPPKASQKFLMLATRDEVFAEDVWSNLADDEKEFFLENNAESQSRIEALVAPFKQAYENALDPGENYILDTVDTDFFDSWLREHADELVPHARVMGGYNDEVDEIVNQHVEAGYSEAQVEEAIDEALQGVENYDNSVSDDYSRAFFKESVSSPGVYLEVRRLPNVSDMDDAEIEYAIKEINSQTDDIFKSRRHRDDGISVTKLRDKHFVFESDIGDDPIAWVAFEPNWHNVAYSVNSILEDVEPESGEKGAVEEKPDTSIEDRTVFRWKDGSNVVELLPKEFVDEGAPYVCQTHGHFYPRDEGRGHHVACKSKDCEAEIKQSDTSLWHCIGDPDHGFQTKARKGVGKAWSLRTQSGKRKIAIFADLKRDGSIRTISQAKGYRNRLPGFESSEAGGRGIEGKFKMDEVLKVAEFVASLGVDPYEVGDLGLGLRRVASVASEGNREAKKIVEVMTKISPRFVASGWPTVKSAAAENPRRGKCPNCGGERGGFCS